MPMLFETRWQVRSLCLNGAFAFRGHEIGHNCAQALGYRAVASISTSYTTPSWTREACKRAMPVTRSWWEASRARASSGSQCAPAQSSEGSGRHRRQERHWTRDRYALLLLKARSSRGWTSRGKVWIPRERRARARRRARIGTMSQMRPPSRGWRRADHQHRLAARYQGRSRNGALCRCEGRCHRIREVVRPCARTPRRYCELDRPRADRDAADQGSLHGLEESEERGAAAGPFRHPEEAAPTALLLASSPVEISTQVRRSAPTAPT